jgi:hypothetical protein
VVRPQRRLEAGRLEALDDRRALAAGDDEPVEAVEVLGDANLGRLGAELPQRAGVRPEAALDR